MSRPRPLLNRAKRLPVTAGLNPLSNQKISKSIDIKTTTKDGILKELAEEYYKNNYLAGITTFRGQVYRVKTSYQERSDNPDLNFILSTLVDFYVICKVGIEGLYDFMPIPNTFDETAQDQGIIDMYQDFVIYPQNGEFISVNVGDIVEVTFGNLSNFTEGIILKKISSVSHGQGSTIPIGAKAKEINKKNAFKNKPPEPPPEQQLTTTPEQAEEFVPIPKIHPKDPSNRILRKLDPRMFKPVKQFVEAARAAGYRVVLVSGLRTLQEQAELYAIGREKLTDSKGKKISTVTKAAAGDSPHNFGLGFDFAFMTEDGKIQWPEPGPWKEAAQYAKNFGLVWGGDWKEFVDKPHVEFRDWKKTRSQWISTNKGRLPYEPPV